MKGKERGFPASQQLIYDAESRWLGWAQRSSACLVIKRLWVQITLFFPLSFSMSEFCVLQQVPQRGELCLPPIK